MRYYKITNDLRERLNNFLGMEYLKKRDVGHELTRLENFHVISRVSPKKAGLLMATLFPEELKDAAYFNLHRDEIKHLARKLHIGKVEPPAFNWSYYMIRREGLLPSLEGRRDEDILKGNIIRFR